jgi:integrative and conjugative element protein (TIGR02256 family)
LRSLWRLKSGNSIQVQVSGKALASMNRFRQSDSQPESGGVLLGPFFPDQNRLLICYATRPGRNDVRSRYSFKRDPISAARSARFLWAKSAGRIQYLGEWHTHPDDHPKPSLVDKLTMGRILRKSTVVAGGLLLVIVGRESTWAGFWTRAGYSEVLLTVFDEAN